MKNKLRIRPAERAEMEWINQWYDEVEFVHSHFDQEIIAVAEFDGQKAGLGRLVRLDDQHLELGGMYVLESFRRNGIARGVVKFLLENAKPSQIIYCIPFENLAPFYKQFGFVDCPNLNSVPKKLLEKYLWCKEKYTQPTSLLFINKWLKHDCC